MVKSQLSLMGFDYGSQFMGVAIGQTLTATASPLATIRVRNREPDWEKLSALIQEWQPDLFVVGWPVSRVESAIMRAIREFQSQLQQRYQRPVHLIDETLSTVAAMEYLSLNIDMILSQKVATKDAIAAKIILETWLAQCT